jgi:hypothetical protein
MDYTVEDIEKHCKNLDIRVLLCFEITSANRDSRSFKLAVVAQNTPLVRDGPSWPKGVAVRVWNYKDTPPEVSDEDRQRQNDGTVASNNIDMAESSHASGLLGETSSGGRDEALDANVLQQHEAVLCSTSNVVVGELQQASSSMVIDGMPDSADFVNVVSLAASVAPPSNDVVADVVIAGKSLEKLTA